MFDPSMPSSMGIAIEPWLGWTLLWGVALPFAAVDRPILPVLTAMFWADLLLMPLLEPTLVLGSGWLIGEALALTVALLPALLLARWTASDTHLRARAALQVLCAGAFLLWLAPTAALMRSGGWKDVLELPGWRLSLVAQLLLVPISLGLRAVGEFVRVGEGTPIPYDPPRQLVTTGPYAYVRNPMQVSMVAIFGIAALLLWNPWLLAGALVSLVYGVGLADWHEKIDLSERFGTRWESYRAEVHNWIPRWTPYNTHEANLLVAFSCTTCSSIGRWVMARSPVGLSIAPAEDVRDPGLRRVTYICAGSEPIRGVTAIARSLEHLHLGWAIAGWFLAMPGVSHLAQLVADLFGPSPHVVAGMPYDKNSCDVTTRSVSGPTIEVAPR
jgi:protein-S-isoprenylcysteine O-methyltransferase Ste14